MIKKISAKLLEPGMYVSDFNAGWLAHPFGFNSLLIGREDYPTRAPQASTGIEISPVGRMSAIVDVYDAITSDRVYRKGMSPAVAVQKLFEWSKFHFDPQMMQLFLKSVGIYPVGSLVKLESGRLGVVIAQSESNLLTPTVRVMYDAKRQYYLAPEEVDLTRPMGSGGADRIVGFEIAEKWGIDVARFLQ